MNVFDDNNGGLFVSKAEQGGLRIAEKCHDAAPAFVSRVHHEPAIRPAVVERAGKESRRSESIKMCRAGSSSRRLLSLVVSMTTRRIPQLKVL